MRSPAKGREQGGRGKPGLRVRQEVVQHIVLISFLYKTNYSISCSLLSGRSDGSAGIGCSFTRCAVKPRPSGRGECQLVLRGTGRPGIISLIGYVAPARTR